MKILILLKKWEGGVGVAIQGISKELRNRGHKVDIISREENLKIFSLKKVIFPLRKKIKNLMKKNYDVVYTHDWSLAFPLIFPYSIYKDKHYCCFHGESDTKISKILQYFIGKIMGGKLIVVGNLLKQKFPKSNLVYNGVNINSFKPLKKIKRIKNSVGFSNWKIDTYHYREIKKIVENLNKKFIVAENIPKEKMPEFYNKTETFISLPPKYTGFGLVYLEAMASGVQKIIGNNYGVGKNLPITKIEDFKNIEEAIKNAKGKNYRKWIIENKFTWKNTVKKLLKIWEK